jgi:flagellar basal-body rod modification protein FlgD
MATVASQVAATNTATAQSASKAANSRDKLAKDMNQFMTLLTTQLKHQDPLSPMDSTQFTSQLVQFANVEQHIQSNANLENLIKINQSAMAMSSISYIGKEIEAESNAVPLTDGEAQFSYTLSDRTQQTTIAITNDKGNLVATLQGKNEPGKHGVVWDGTDGYGNTLPDGNYRISITALSPADSKADITSSVFAIGRVSGVSTADGVVKLTMGGVEIPVDKVTSVRDAAL